MVDRSAEGRKRTSPPISAPNPSRPHPSLTYLPLLLLSPPSPLKLALEIQLRGLQEHAKFVQKNIKFHHTFATILMILMINE